MAIETYFSVSIAPQTKKVELKLLNTQTDHVIVAVPLSPKSIDEIIECLRIAREVLESKGNTVEKEVK